MVCASEGIDPNNINHIQLGTMTFTFKFAAKSYSEFQSKEQDNKASSNQYRSSKGNQNEDDFIDSSDNDTLMTGNDEEANNESSDINETTIESSNGQDDIRSYSGHDVIVGSSSAEGEPTDVQGDANTEEQGHSHSTTSSDPGEARVIFWSDNDNQAMVTIDQWKHDAVNWYTKANQLAVENALQNQAISVDHIGF